MSAPEFTAVHPIVFTKTVSGTKVVDQLTNQLTCWHSHPKTHRSSSSHSDWRLYWKSTNTATLVKTNMTYILYVTDRITKTIDIWRQMHTHKTWHLTQHTKKATIILSCFSAKHQHHLKTQITKTSRNRMWVVVDLLDSALWALDCIHKTKITTLW